MVPPIATVLVTRVVVTYLVHNQVALADIGSAGDPPPRSKFVRFHEVFGKIIACPPPNRLSGKNRIRHWDETLMAHTHCTEQGPGTGPESKWVTIFYAELLTLHWNRKQDRTPLGFIHIFPFLFLLPFPVPCNVSELLVTNRCRTNITNQITSLLQVLK